jgi:dUTP pyrophosphatase
MSTLNTNNYLRFIRTSPNAKTPTRGSPLAAGHDLYSSTEITIDAYGKAIIPTDIIIAVPNGTYGRVAPRSGLAVKHSIHVGAGVIDEDYRGLLNVILFNHSNVSYKVKKGDKIAQLICEKIVYPTLLEVTELEHTQRGTQGFGSTGY